MKLEVYSFVIKNFDLKIRTLEKEKKLYAEEEFERKKKEARERYGDLMKDLYECDLCSAKFAKVNYLRYHKYF